MPDASLLDTTRKAMARLAYAILSCVTVVTSTLPVLGERASASPADPPDPPLPVITVHPTSWQPQFPFPYDANRKDVTEADITAEREMCQWFSAEYRELVRQIDRFGFNLAEANNHWTVGKTPA